MYTHDNFLIGSRWQTAHGTETFQVISPSTEESVGSIPIATPADIDDAVTAAARAAEGPWRRMSVRDRGALLTELAERLLTDIDLVVETQIDEMGSIRSFIDPLTRGYLKTVPSQIEVVDSIPLRSVRQMGGGASVTVVSEPVGVVAAIIPWNGPIATTIGRLQAALLTGCTLVLKPPPESPLSGYLVAQAAIDAGIPEGVLSVVPGGREIGEYLVTHRGVDKVSFTGSSTAGSRVASLCGQNMKRMTLELGGKSAAIVLDDVDLDNQLAAILTSSMPNTGQACYATTRVLVPRSRAREIGEVVADAVSKLVVGDPHDTASQVGPLAASRQRDTVESFIASGRQQGAEVLTGGGRPEGLDRGWYVEPTVFAGVDNASRIAQEEIFGPVLSLIEYDDDDDAVRIANDSKYGLGGAVFTSDAERGMRLAERMHTGSCAINGAAPGGGGGPFGGIKQSGMGRERGVEGYASYYELKSISLPQGNSSGA